MTDSESTGCEAEPDRVDFRETPRWGSGSPISAWNVVPPMAITTIAGMHLIAVGIVESRLLIDLLVAAWLLIGRQSFDFRRLLGIRGVALSAAIGAFHMADTRLGLLVTASLMASLVANSLRSEGARSPGRSTLTLFPGLVGISAALHAALPVSQRLWASVADVFSTGLSTVSGSAVQYGPTILGFGVAGTALAYGAAALAYHRYRLASLVSFGLVFVLCLTVGPLVLASLPAPWQRHNVVAGAPLLHLGIWLVGTGAWTWFVRGSASARELPTGSRSGWILAFATVVGFALLISNDAAQVRDRPSIVFESRHEGPLLNWEQPKHGVYEGQLGMVGQLPFYLSRHGAEVTLAREGVTERDLADADLLVMINYNQSWTDQELDCIWSFVESGGCLLVFGDHTDGLGLREPNNQLLERVGIALNFDAPLQPNFTLDQAVLYPHPSVAGVCDADESRFGIGASLTLSKSAKPLLLSRLSYSDLGDRENVENNFFGDLEYAQGEPIGDIVLAATARYGRGDVVVFGDTSGLQNPLLWETYPSFYQQLFSWCTAKKVVRLPIALEGCVGLLLLLALILALRDLRRYEWSAPAVGVALAATIGIGGALHSASLERGPIELPTALIDLTHAPEIDWQSGPNAVGALTANLQRSGWLPAQFSNFEQLGSNGAELLFILAPQSAYSKDQCDRLKSFMERGGHVVVAAGQDHYDAVSSLVEGGGWRIGESPIGPIPLQRLSGRARIGVEYVEAWPIVGVQIEAGDQVLGAFRGQALFVMRPVGAGSLAWVADSRFFSEENLEDEDSHSLPNLAFLRGLLSRVGAKEGS